MAATLTYDQRNAAREAALCMLRGSPNREADRADYAAAKVKLAALLPADADVDAIIRDAVRWEITDAIASMLEAA
jgi:hypothetical protein